MNKKKFPLILIKLFKKKFKKRNLKKKKKKKKKMYEHAIQLFLFCLARKQSEDSVSFTRDKRERENDSF